ncbi:signaling peptide TAXIMIN 2-like [Arachis stenosperma]|uniref:signaling peptide TAXIMIN 2-like n=1 Tax=Arachis stenosperma TaxID=217475 RepID=UPI0025ABE316|nr:signaling peptide TAXIMIN 2-like [Arachis stenosperma]
MPSDKSISPKTSERKKEKFDEDDGFCFECRPLAFVLGLPFALLALVLSVVGAIVWILGAILRCFCPCCGCIAELANLAMDLVQLPVRILRWFIDLIPC